MEIRTKYSFRFNDGILVLFTVVIGIFLIIMPKHADDFRFLNFVSQWFFNQGINDLNSGGNIFEYGLPFSDIFYTWRELWEVDNIRLGNLLAVFLLLFPKWLISTGSLLIWIYCMIESLRLAGVSVRKSPLVAFALLLWAVFIPWSDSMGSVVFQINYIWISGMTLWLIRKLDIRTFPIGNIKRKSLWQIVLFTVSGVCVGWWHEGFGLSVIAGLLAVALMFRSYLKAPLVFTLIGLVLGCAIIAITPGTLNRIGLQVDLQPVMLRYRIFEALIINLLYWIFLVTYIYFRFFRRQEFQKNPLTIFCLTSGLIPILLSIATYTVGRVTFWTQIVSVIGMLSLLHCGTSVYWRKYSMKNLVWILPCCAVVLTYWVICDINICINRRVFDSSIQAYASNPEKTIFGNIRTYKDFPPSFFGLPAGPFVNKHTFVDVGEVYRDVNPGCDFKIIPEQLRNVTKSTGKEFESLHSARIYEGYVFIPADSIDLDDFSFIEYDADFGKGFVPVRGYSYLFTSERDGQRYYYLQISTPWFVHNFRELGDIRIRSVKPPVYSTSTSAFM